MDMVVGGKIENCGDLTHQY